MNHPASTPERRHAWYATLLRDVRAFVHRRVQPASDAEDVVQEVLLRVVRGLGTLEDRTRLHAWVYRIARHAIADHYRGKSAGRAVPQEETEAVVVPGQDAPRDDPAGELGAWLMLAIEELPEPYRETLRLTEIDGLTYPEVARRLGLSVSAVKSRVARGREQLRKALLRCCQVELDVRGGVSSYRPRNPCAC